MKELEYFDSKAISEMDHTELDKEDEFESTMQEIHKALDKQVDFTGKNMDLVVSGIIRLNRIISNLKQENEELKKRADFMEKCIFAMNN